jgi:glycosyltransferase involved in cell wall biosynthesis
MRRAPRVSCICVTYNRPPAQRWLLEEALESFRRQRYPNRELVILNDCPAQELVCHVPGVRVLNAEGRFPTLGEKMNAAIERSSGELVAVWDDDDISLPWRLETSVQALGDEAYFNPGGYWFLDGRGLHFDHAIGLAHATAIFSRRAFENVGGYPAESGAYDQVLDWRLRELGVASPLAAFGPAHWFYIYRWGVSPVHMSGRTPYEWWYEEIGTRPVVGGRFELVPRWHREWTRVTRDHLAGVRDPSLRTSSDLVLESTAGAV